MNYKYLNFILYYEVIILNSGLNPIVDIAYPEIKVMEKDLPFAYKLLDAYAGNVSEFSAVGQYSFQSIYLSEYKDLSKILKNISIVEMKHIEILGELIKELGLIPYYVIYKNQKAIPWNSDYINFTTNYRDMLVSNINKENESINNYNKLISETNDQNIKNILNRIILDEKRHIEVLTKLLNQYDE